MDLASKSNEAICNETCIIRNGQKQMKISLMQPGKYIFYKYWFLQLLKTLILGGDTRDEEETEKQHDDGSGVGCEL